MRLVHHSVLYGYLFRTQLHVFELNHRLPKVGGNMFGG